MTEPSTRIALLSTSDTDLLSARASGSSYHWANPSRASDDDLSAAVADADLVVVRLLGSPHDLWPGLSAVREGRLWAAEELGLTISPSIVPMSSPRPSE